MDKQEYHELWADDAHWSGGIYFCKADPRLVVRKRIAWTGWTFNFGHRFGSTALISLIMLPFLVLLGIVLVGVLGMGLS